MSAICFPDTRESSVFILQNNIYIYSQQDVRNIPFQFFDFTSQVNRPADARYSPRGSG